MLWLNSKSDRPDFGWFRNFLNARSAEGIRVERPEEKVRNAEMLAGEAAKWLRDECGIANPNSPKQITDYMASIVDTNIETYCYDRFKNKFSSAEDGLVELANLDYKWAMQILKYRASAGVIKNVTSIMGCSDMKGLIHPEISFQKTNRVSYTGPALMNINKEILWDTIKPIKAGNYLWSADIKNQEPWILAHMTGASKLIELAAKASDAGCSLYKAVYEDIFGTAIESEEAYGEMKMAWNMLTYGGSIQGLRQRCKVIDPDKVYTYFNGIKELSDYRGRTFGLARKNINSVMTVFGTTVSTDAVGSHLQRSLMDIPIQGTGADILCMLVHHITKELAEMGIADKIKVYFTRHDEIIFEVDKYWQEEMGIEAIKEIIAELARHRIDDWTEFGIDVEQVS